MVIIANDKYDFMKSNLRILPIWPQMPKHILASFPKPNIVQISCDIVRYRICLNIKILYVIN